MQLAQLCLVWALLCLAAHGEVVKFEHTAEMAYWDELTGAVPGQTMFNNLFVLPKFWFHVCGQRETWQSAKNDFNYEALFPMEEDGVTAKVGWRDGAVEDFRGFESKLGSKQVLREIYTDEWFAENNIKYGDQVVTFLPQTSFFLGALPKDKAGEEYKAKFAALKADFKRAVDANPSGVVIKPATGSNSAGLLFLKPTANAAAGFDYKFVFEDFSEIKKDFTVKENFDQVFEQWFTDQQTPGAYLAEPYLQTVVEIRTNLVYMNAIVNWDDARHPDEDDYDVFWRKDGSNNEFTKDVYGYVDEPARFQAIAKQVELGWKYGGRVIDARHVESLMTNLHQIAETILAKGWPMEYGRIDFFVIPGAQPEDAPKVYINEMQNSGEIPFWVMQNRDDGQHGNPCVLQGIGTSKEEGRPRPKPAALVAPPPMPPPMPGNKGGPPPMPGNKGGPPMPPKGKVKGKEDNVPVQLKGKKEEDKRSFSTVASSPYQVRTFLPAVCFVVLTLVIVVKYIWNQDDDSKQPLLHNSKEAVFGV